VISFLALLRFDRNTLEVNETMESQSGELFKKALDLGERDRATLAGLLIESLEEEPDENLEALWKAEIEHRLKQLDLGEVEAIPWEEVKARLMRKPHG
jgi:putative addiction module component (TIGR02574 family)